MQHSSSLVIPIVEQVPCPTNQPSSRTLILHLSSLLLQHVLNLLDVLNLGHRLGFAILRELVGPLHLVISRMEDGLKGRPLQLSNQFAHLLSVVPLKLWILAIGLLEGEHIVLAVYALLIIIRLDDCLEKPIARQLLVIMRKNKHIEL